MRNVLVILFKTCLVLFLFGGTCLVLGQLGGLILQNGDMVIKAWDIFANPTFIISAIGGVLGFILGYMPKKKTDEVKQSSSDEFNEDLERVQSKVLINR